MDRGVLEIKLNEVIDLLKKDGCNSKKQAINKLEEIKKELKAKDGT